MNKNYLKLKQVQGLIIGLDEQIYQHRQLGKLDKQLEGELIDAFFNQIKAVVNG